MYTHKITVQIIFVFTLLAIALGVFSYRSSVDNKVENPIAVDEIGTEYEEGKIYDMPSNLIFTSDVEETADNSGITLKATVKPSVAYDKSLTWSVKWKNSADSFATDNPDVTKFVTVTSKSSDTAEVICLKPFGSQIEVIATSVSNTNAKATCTLDYMQKILDFTYRLVIDDLYQGTKECDFILNSLLSPTGGKVNMFPRVAESVGMIDTVYLRWLRSSYLDLRSEDYIYSDVYTISDWISDMKFSFCPTDSMINAFKANGLNLTSRFTSPLEGNILGYLFAILQIPIVDEEDFCYSSFHDEIRKALRANKDADFICKVEIKMSSGKTITAISEHSFDI